MIEALQEQYEWERDAPADNIEVLRRSMEAAQERYRAGLHATVRRYAALGLSTRRIAAKVGVSHQRVAQILAEESS